MKENCRKSYLLDPPFPHLPPRVSPSPVSPLPSPTLAAYSSPFQFSFFQSSDNRSRWMMTYLYTYTVCINMYIFIYMYSYIYIRICVGVYILFIYTIYTLTVPFPSVFLYSSVSSVMCHLFSYTVIQGRVRPSLTPPLPLRHREPPSPKKALPVYTSGVFGFLSAPQLINNQRRYFSSGILTFDLMSYSLPPFGGHCALHPIMCV
ncbi:unnamed protein product [Boreogadus saida]